MILKSELGQIVLLLINPLALIVLILFYSYINQWHLLSLIILASVFTYMSTIIITVLKNIRSNIQLTEANEIIYKDIFYSKKDYDYSYNEFFLGLRNIPFLIIESKFELVLTPKDNLNKEIRVNCSNYSQFSKDILIKATRN